MLSPRGPYSGLTSACVASAPIPLCACGQSAPTAKKRLAIATAKAPLFERATIDQVMSVAPRTRVPSNRTRRPRPASWLHALDDRRDALSAADAHGHQRVASAGALKLVHRLDGEDASCRADRMSERDRTTVRIDLRRIEAQLLVDAERLRGEGLVGFDDVDLFELEPSLRERAPDRAH